MSTVVKFPVHARASAGESFGKKSSAVTAPSVAALIRAASSHEGLLMPRLIRLIDVRSACTSSASCPSSSPRADIQSASRMLEKCITCTCVSSTSCMRCRGLEDECAQNAHMPPVPKPRPRFPTFLRHWRVYRKLTQETACERLDIDRSTLSKIERGLVPYSQGLLERAADAYNCEPADLLMRDPESPIWSLMDSLRRLPEAQQRVLVGAIRGMLETIEKAA